MTLSWTHVLAATWLRKHWTVFDAVDVVAAVVPVRHPHHAVGYSLLIGDRRLLGVDRPLRPADRPRLVVITMTPFAASVP